MWTCPRCSAKVDAGFEVCWACGASADGEEDPGFRPETEGIMAAEDLPLPEPEPTYVDWVSLTFFSRPAEAYAIQARLEAAAIPVFLADENAASWLSFTGLGGIRVQVPREDAERARRVLEEAVEAGDLPPP